VATAIHNGHHVRPELHEWMALTDQDALREEDPHTGLLAQVAPTRVIVHRSRFETDLNRGPDRPVYLRPEDAWGLQVWKGELPEDVFGRSREVYEAFYADIRAFLDRVEKRSGRFVVLDIHSYNHQRGGPDAEFDDPEKNPEINLGTASLNRELWGPVADCFAERMSSFDFGGRKLDVRENVKFKGGYFSRWIHRNYPDSGCALAIEFKKTFMNEWTGEVDRDHFEMLRRALAHACQGILQVLAG